MKTHYRAPLFACLALLATLGDASAASLTVIVPGTSDPWLAGMPNGSTASANDRAPAQSPVLVSGLWFTAGVALVFNATGTVGNSPESGDFMPEGNLPGITPHGAGAENGIASATMPFNAFVGVFLGPDQPSLTPAPPALDFTTQEERDFLSLRPKLKQVFFIGDGRTSEGRIQEIIPPAGATRLFLGTMDQWSWLDNHGSFSVMVTQANASAQPSDSFDAFAEFSPFQGGTSGVWFYQEFDGATFADLVIQPLVILSLDSNPLGQPAAQSCHCFSGTQLLPMVWCFIRDFQEVARSRRVTMSR